MERDRGTAEASDSGDRGPGCTPWAWWLRLRKTVAGVTKHHQPGDLTDLASSDASLIRRLGILAVPLDEKVTPMLPDLRRLSGVVVVAIPAEYAALNPGLASPDVIYELNGTRVATVEELRGALDRFKAGAPVALLVERDSQFLYVTFEIE